MERSEEQGLFDIYEVFVQKSQGDFHTHVGSVVAPSPDHALHMARENFIRREPAVNIWVVPREHVHATPYEEPDFFAREMDRKYREVSGYSENGRLWRMFREKALSIEEIVKALEDQEVQKKKSQKEK